MKKYSAFLQIFMALIMVSASLQRTACSLDTRNKLVSTARTTIVSPASSTRCEHISSMDATSGKIYVWGGMINTSNMVGSYPKDGGIYDPVGDSWATWTSAGAAGAPAARSEIPFWYLGSNKSLVTMGHKSGGTRYQIGAVIDLSIPGTPT